MTEINPRLKVNERGCPYVDLADLVKAKLERFQGGGLTHPPILTDRWIFRIRILNRWTILSLTVWRNRTNA